MKRLLQDERGMALALAIFALVIIGAMVAGAFFAGTQEQRVGENTRRLAASFGVAETGVYEQLRGWTPSTFNSLPVYPNSTYVGTATVPNGRGSYQYSVYKLNSDMYLLSVTGRDTASKNARNAGGGGRSSLGVLLRIKPLNVDIEAALTTTRGDQIQGTASISGWDQTPTGWTGCPAPGAGLAGVRADTGAAVQTGGSGTVMGNPPVKIDPTVTDS